MSKNQEEFINNLVSILANISNEDEMLGFLHDLLTEKEMENLAIRLNCAHLLYSGKTYSEVIKETKISSTTLSRISRCLRQGKGYNSVLKGKKKEQLKI